MKADGSDQLRLTRSPADHGHTSWSPNGQLIAFDSGRKGNWAREQVPVALSVGESIATRKLAT